MKKTVIIILDGMPDDDIKNSKTPVEKAVTPELQRMARKSWPIMVQTTFQALPIGSIVANLSLLGYDPYKYFPEGRSYFELRARYTEEIAEDDLILRCNTISVNTNDEISDFTAGQIPERLAEKIIERSSDKLPKHFDLIHGKNYRNTVIVKNSSLKPGDLIAFEPHSRVGSNIFDLRILHSNRQLTATQMDEIRYLNSVMYGSLSWLADINDDLGSSADMLWFWAPSHAASLFDFREHYGFLNPWIITGSDFLHGIGDAAGISSEMKKKFTGESDTDFAGKGRDAVEKLSAGADFLYVHVNATDEEAHQRNYDGKVSIIEEVDRHIIGPILNFVNSSNDHYSLVIGGDHYTSSATGNHLGNEVPFIVYQPNNTTDKLTDYSESEIAEKSVSSLVGTELINYVSDGNIQADQA